MKARIRSSFSGPGPGPGRVVVRGRAQQPRPVAAARPIPPARVNTTRGPSAEKFNELARRTIRRWPVPSGRLDQKTPAVVIPPRLPVRAIRPVAPGTRRPPPRRHLLSPSCSRLCRGAEDDCSGRRPGVRAGAGLAHAVRVGASVSIQRGPVRTVNPRDRRPEGLAARQAPPRLGKRPDERAATRTKLALEAGAVD